MLTLPAVQRNPKREDTINVDSTYRIQKPLTARRRSGPVAGMARSHPGSRHPGWSATSALAVEGLGILRALLADDARPVRPEFAASPPACPSHAAMAPSCAAGCAAPDLRCTCSTFQSSDSNRLINCCSCCSWTACCCCSRRSSPAPEQRDRMDTLQRGSAVEMTLRILSNASRHTSEAAAGGAQVRSA